MPRANLEAPSRLSAIVNNLRAQPRLTLPQLSSLRLTLASRNDHFGARHFLKEQLPRIRFANPDLDIKVRKLIKRPQDEWRPEIELSFRDGKTQTMNLHAQWSTSIVRSLMDAAGSPAWFRWLTEVERTGAPIFPGQENAQESISARSVGPEPRFSYDQWKAKHPGKIRDVKKQQRAAVRPVVLVDRAQATIEAGQRKQARKEAKQAMLDAPRLAEEEAERRVAEELASKPRTGAAAILP
ncbi:unnamed protein product [Mycena citricolor]|uniref:Ribosomal protein/NADH dehydrogenase domain-containing protein n=1 Tax=Mycena citricolor TaxID=2018698 RepID=A0AAD2H827_9AGAR|nr:unnamed protein product [Mycena citricolor]CAK5269899.1 unnamed protein product [Mycena citricolor]CAK5284310.1 unnamed protein product [Mycena citricolor]